MSRFLKAKDRTFEGLEDCGEFSPFFFMQLADTQYGFWKQNQSWEEERDLARQTIAHINRLKPAFVVVCGDIVNAWPDSEEKVQKDQFNDFKEDFQAIDESIPLVCVCGNHDVGNTPTRATIKQYTDQLGDDYLRFFVCLYIYLYCIFFISSINLFL